jgi:diaminobutyrate acetyltransferase
MLLPTTDPTDHPAAKDAPVVIRRPSLEDGAHMWRLARDSKVLDVNASYAYVLWARDFAATTVVASVAGEPVGFVTGYVRPDEPKTLMVWQVAVDEGHRGRGLARQMLHELTDQAAPLHMETTITPDNEASIALFTRFAEDRGADIAREPVFDASVFPDGHETELLFQISPLR